MQIVIDKENLITVFSFALYTVSGGKPEYENAKNAAIEFIEQIGYTPFAKPKTGECKYCTHWEKLNYEAPRQGWCNHFKNWTDADEYCSRYVRGEENDKG